jgi:hypothetical protein
MVKMDWRKCTPQPLAGNPFGNKYFVFFQEALGVNKFVPPVYCVLVKVC